METAYIRPLNDFRSPGRAPRCKPEVDDDVSDGSATLDENEEWAKIENIMASLDAGLPDCDVTANGVTSSHSRSVAVTTTPYRQSSAAGGDVSQTLSQFLASRNLSHIEDILVANGFDELDFMGPGFMCDTDLVDVGVTNADDRVQLLSAVSRLPSSLHCTPKQFDCVRTWLRSLRLSEYIDTFQIHGFTTLERLHNLWDVELTSVLRISRLGHRNRILAAIGSLPFVPPVPGSSSTYQVNDKDPASTSHTTKQSLNELSLYKDYTSLLHTRSNTSHSLTADRHPRQRLQQQQPSLPRQRDTPQQQQHQRGRRQQEQIQDRQQRRRQLPKPEPVTAEYLQLRPPQTCDSRVKQWSHRPEILIRKGCSYPALYIGSDLVSEIDNPDTTRSAIASIRQGSVTSSQGVINIILSISHTGVKFCRSTNEEQLGAHDIDSIFCACQDGSLLDYFAYVAWVADLGQHQCHVFRAESVQMAVEMVLTLGQAFEVAYQLAVLKNGASEASGAACVDKTSGTTQAVDGVWIPPVNSVKPLRTTVVTNSSNITVGL